MRVTIDVDESDLMSECSVEMLQDAIKRKRGKPPEEAPETRSLLERAYYAMRDRECPQELRDYFWLVLGRAL